MKRSNARSVMPRWFSGVACIAVVLLASAVCRAATGKAYAVPLLSRATSSAANLQLRWQTPIGLSSSNRDHVVNLWHVGDMVYVLTSKSYIVAIDASNGTVRWTRQIHGMNAAISRPVVSGPHQIIVLSSSAAHYLNTRTGATQTQAKLPFPPGTYPVLIPGSRLLIGSLNEGFNALSAVPPFFPEWTEDSPGDSYISTPVVASSTVIFGSRLGYLWGRIPTDGNHGWKRTLEGGIRAPLTANDSLAFVPCLDNNLYAVDPQSGVSPWVRHLPGILAHRAGISGKKLLIITGGKGLFSLNSSNGKILWGPVPGVARIVARKGATIYASTVSGNLKMINIGSGRVTDSAVLNGAKFFAYNATTPTIFVASKYGRVAAIKPRRQW